MIPIPYRDENPTATRPVVTIGIILVNLAAWIYELSHGVDVSTLQYGAIPAWVLHGVSAGRIALPGGSFFVQQGVPAPLTVFTSMFMHGGWLHIIGNMWFLWLFGDNVEDAMGHGAYLFFYILAGVVASLSYIAMSPHSGVPMVGASGAIAGVLGAYIVLYPRARVRCIWILIIFITFIAVPAWLLLGLWFLTQFLISPGAGVATGAHVGGFIFGALMVSVFARRRPSRGRVAVR